MSLLAGFGDLGLNALKTEVQTKIDQFNGILGTVEGLDTLLQRVEDAEIEIIALKSQLATQDAG